MAPLNDIKRIRTTSPRKNSPGGQLPELSSRGVFSGGAVLWGICPPGELSGRSRHWGSCPGIKITTKQINLPTDSITDEQSTVGHMKYVTQVLDLT